MLVRNDRAKYSGGVYNESTLVLVVGVVVDCLVNCLEAGGEDGSSSVSHVLGSVSVFLRSFPPPLLQSGAK